ncbi:hypothetical protein ACFVXG_14735 [Kitasatospora sp. NPDC058162]|uniref:hypothetical protein n=1 Tax=Kitasatospora sp. NPDC058162 TaxID=3346362 RepID=UPI0036DE3700
MPGQRARKRKQAEELRRWSERRAAAGPWEVLHSTEDPAEHRAFVRQLYEAGVPDDVEVVCDVLCGRLVQPTWYRVRTRRLDGGGPGPDGAQGGQDAQSAQG